MFGDYSLRRDFNIGKSDGFHLLPSIIIYCAGGGYFEISISFLKVTFYWCYSIHNMRDD